MRKNREVYLRLAEDVAFRDGRITIKSLARRVGSSYSASQLMAAKLDIPVLSKDEQLVEKYRRAVFVIRTTDKFGIVTVQALVKNLGLLPDSIRQFFRKRPDLKQQWGVLTNIEALPERLHRAADRFRRENPGKELHRKELAHEAGITEKALSSYLASHPGLSTQLRLVYTNPWCSIGRSGKKGRKRPK